MFLVLTHPRCPLQNASHPPPYIPAADDIFSGQAAVLAGKDPSIDTSELAVEVEKIQDTALLRRLLVEKEHERQHLASDLDLAARLGLGLQQQLEHVEIESYAKIQALQDQNMMLQSKANRSKELSTQLAGSENEIKILTTQNHILQRELDMCRKDFKTFRSELDELTEQMSEMASEMMEAKSKVNTYARRLGEVEQELASTQELNVNLQVQLENALQKQKQSHSTTTMVVKSIQSDLGKVFSESDSMKMTLEELETRQVKCEGKVTEMITNTREYAQLLEEAQDTIHNLRQESDMQGRGWSQARGSRPQRSMGNAGTATTRTNEDAIQHQSLASELDPDHWDDDGGAGGSSLGAELGGTLASELSEGSLGDAMRRMRRSASSLSEVTEDTDPTVMNDPEDESSGTSLASELQLVEAATQTSPIPTSPSNNHRRVRGDRTTPPTTPRSPSQSPSIHHSNNFRDRARASTGSLPNRASGDSELHARLETSNIFRSMLSGMSRPPWNPSVALEKPAHTPSIRAPLTASTGASPHRRNSRATSPHSSSLSASTGSLFALANGHRGSISAASTTSSTSSSSPSLGRSRSGAIDHQPGLRYLLSASCSSELSNVITKTKANKSAGSTGSIVPSKSSSSVSSLAISSGSNQHVYSALNPPGPGKDRPQQMQQAQQPSLLETQTNDLPSQPDQSDRAEHDVEPSQVATPIPPDGPTTPEPTMISSPIINAIENTPRTDSTSIHDTPSTDSVVDTKDTSEGTEKRPELADEPTTKTMTASTPQTASDLAKPYEEPAMGRMSPSRPPLAPSAAARPSSPSSSIRSRSVSPMRRSSVSGSASGRNSPSSTSRLGGRTAMPTNPPGSGRLSPGAAAVGTGINGARPIPVSAFGRTNSRSPSPAPSASSRAKLSANIRPGLTRTLSANSTGSNASSSSSSSTMLSAGRLGANRTTTTTTGATLSPSSSKPASRRSSFSH
ncbi:hypothetical protein DFQ26_007282 [Actinomortierella ambigua]|nr:hypothetical protein DFQ26_007282 [Actinomortierella ambigua]